MRDFKLIRLLLIAFSIFPMTALAANLFVDGNLSVTGTLSGDGSGLVELNASNITSGVVSEPLIDPLVARDSEVDAAVSNLAPLVHSHDDLYYSKSHVDALESRLEQRMGLRGSTLWLMTDWYQGSEITDFTVVHFTYLGNASGAFVSCLWESTMVPDAGFELENAVCLVARHGGRILRHSD